MPRPHKTELERIRAAEEEAQKVVDKMPPEVVENLGSGLLSDLTHEYLLAGIPSDELAESMKEVESPPDDDSL